MAKCFFCGKPATVGVVSHDGCGFFNRRFRTVLCPDGAMTNTQLSLLECTTMIQDPENPNTVWAKLPDGLRLIFRDGKYAGSYDPNQPEVLS